MPATRITALKEDANIRELFGSIVEVGQFDSSKISLIYRRYRYIGIVSAVGTLDIGFFRYTDIVLVTSKISVIFRYFSILFQLLSVNLSVSILFGNAIAIRRYTSLHLVEGCYSGGRHWNLYYIVTSLPVRNEVKE